MAFSIKKTGLWIGGGILVLIGMTAIGAILASNADVFVNVIKTFDTHKFIWLFWRLTIYSVCIFLFYKIFIIFNNPKNNTRIEQVKHLKRLIIAFSICVLMVELVIWTN